MLRVFPVLLLAFAVSHLSAQITTFKKRHGTPGDDEARFVEVLADNSFIVAGSSTEGGLGGVDAILVKFNADGVVEWSKSFGGAGDEFFMHILTCSDGNYIAVGETNSFGAGNVDIYVVKFDAGGTVIWERTCGGSGQEWSCGGACEVADGYIITGGTQSFGPGFWDAFVEKLDLSGSSVWTKSWGTAGADVSGEPLPASNGDIWVSGGYFAGNQEGFLFRLNSSGTYQNGLRLGGSGHEGSEFIALGGAGISVSGATWSYSNNTQYQPWIISFNTSGNFVWGKRYVFPAGNHNMNAENCPDGGYIFTPLNINTDEAAAYLARTDPNGNIVWAKSHPFSGRMYHAKPCPDGGYVAVGFSAGNGRDMFILKTDSEGNVAGCIPTYVAVNALVINPGVPSVSPSTANGPIAGVPAGQDESVGLTETIICNSVSTESVKAPFILALVPNPTRGTFRIWGSEQIELDLQIFDSTGRLCFSSTIQTNQNIVPGALPAGVYLVYVTDNGGRIQHFRMVRE